MLDKLKTMLFGPQGSERLTDLHPDEPVAVAALLLEAAEADREYAPEEQGLIGDMLGRHFGLSQPEVEDLLRTTQEARAASNDLWPFTNAIARAYGPEDKLRLLEMVWRVIFADGRLDPYEEQLTRRLHAMLSVNHSVVMEAKRLAREATAKEATAD